MSKNHIGTLLRIVVIFIALFSLWSILLGILYFMVSYLFDLSFNLKGFILCFVGFVLLRIFFRR